MNRKNKLQIYAGVGLLTAALLMHMGINVKNNPRNQVAYLNNNQKITGEIKEKTEEKKQGR